MTEESEDALVARVQAGDTQAFGQLIDRHGRVIYNLALRMCGDVEDARDLAQSVFVKAYERRASFDRSGRFFSWLYRIAINETLNHLKRQRRQEPLDDDAMAPTGNPEARWEAAKNEALVTRALMQLKTEYREVVILRHFLDLSYRETGDLLHLPEKTVKSRLFTAREQLREILMRRGYVPS